MKNQPSSSITGHNSGWLLAPKLAFSQLAFGSRYLWYKFGPQFLILRPAKAAKKTKHLKQITQIKVSAISSRPNYAGLLILPLAISSFAFLCFQIIKLSQSTSILNLYSPLAETVSASIVPQPLPSPLTISQTDRQSIFLQDLTQTLNRNLELLQQQPLHQNLLINTALIYYQLQDEASYQKYLNLAQNINPNLEIFPIAVEN